MAQLISPTQTVVKVVPRDGEIEITLNINITLDGQVSTCVADKEEPEKSEKEEKKLDLMPDFSSGFKLNFGKSC